MDTFGYRTVTNLRADIKASSSRIHDLRVKANHLIRCARKITRLPKTEWDALTPEDQKTRTTKAGTLRSQGLSLRDEDNEQRYRYLALGFLRGHTYRQIEPKTSQVPDRKVNPARMAQGILGHISNGDEALIQTWIETGNATPVLCLTDPRYLEFKARRDNAKQIVEATKTLLAAE